MEFLEHMAQGAVGAWLAYRFLARRDEKKNYPYKWVCPEEDCIFSIRANDPTIVAIQAGRHEERHKYD